MKLNGKPFKIYFADTAESIINRIAALLSTSPRWLIFETDGAVLDKKYFEQDIDIKVKDYLALIRNQDRLELDFTTPCPAGITLEEIQDIFVASNTLLITAEKDPTTLNAYLFIIKRQIGGREENQIWRNRQTIVRNIEKEIEDNRIKSEKIEMINSAIESVPYVNFTLYTITHVQFTVDMGPYEGDLFALFDSVVLNQNVPYAACSLSAHKRDMFKIFQEFRVNPVWLELQLNNVLLLKVNSTREQQPLNFFKHYTSAAFTIDDSGHLVGTLDTIESKESSRVPYLTREEFTNRVLDVFKGLRNTVQSSSDNMISSRFVIPKQCFDATIFAHIVMLNNLISNFVAIDEFAQPSRVISNSAYIKLLDNPVNTVSLTLKQTEKPKEYGMNNIGEWYIMCRTRTVATCDIRPIQELVGKIIHVYNTDFEEMAGFYQRFLTPSQYTPITCLTKSPMTKRMKNMKGRTGLALIEPTIFEQHYSRMCSSQPVIVENENEAVDSEGNQLQVMKFPLKGEKGPDGTPYKTRLYTCKSSSSHKFVGLRKNSIMNNNVQFPYVPCCFITDQTQRKNSPYQRYYNNVQVEEENKDCINTNCDTSGHLEPIIIRDGVEVVRSPIADFSSRFDDYNLILEKRPGPGPGELEELPDQLRKLFKIIDLKAERVYVRCGVYRTRFSSIEAILYAVNKVGYKHTRTTTRQNKVLSYYNNLMKNADRYAISAKQELYRHSVDEIIEMFKTQLLVPSRFVRMLELLLDYNIFIFTPENGLFIPDHSKMYLKPYPRKHTILLYEHSGGVIDIIGRRDMFGPPDTFLGNFLPSDQMIKNLYNLHRKLSMAYFKDVDGVIRRFPMMILPSSLKITGQILDSHGKCRAVVVDNEFSLVPDIPIPPFAVDIVTTFPRTTLENVKRKFPESDILWKRCSKGVCREIGIKIGSMQVTVLTNDPKHSESLIYPRQPQLEPFYENLESENLIALYQIEKKNAYDRLKNTVSEILSRLNNLAELDTVLHDYALEHGGFTESNLRLLYACRQWIKTHRATDVNLIVLSSEILKNVSMTYVLSGIESVKRLIETYDYDYNTIFNRPISNATLPYYFRCNDIVYLAIRVDSIDMANKVIDFWAKTARVVVTDDKLPHTNNTYRIMAFIDINKMREITRRSDDNIDNYDEGSEKGLILTDPLHESENDDITALLKL